MYLLASAALGKVTYCPASAEIPSIAPSPPFALNEVKYGDSVPLPTDIPVYKDGLFLTGWSQSESAKTALKSERDYIHAALTAA